jgi:hypothetical protein
VSSFTTTECWVWPSLVQARPGPAITPSEQQDDAEADVERFKEDLGPFVVAAETTRMPMVFTDAKHANNSIIFANDNFISLVGYQRNEVLGQGSNFVLASATNAEPLAAIKAEFGEGLCTGQDLLPPQGWQHVPSFHAIQASKRAATVFNDRISA